MARSLTISQEETPTTSGLLNAFLFLAFAWLAFAALIFVYFHLFKFIFIDFH